MKKLLLLLVVRIGCTTAKEPVQKDRFTIYTDNLIETSYKVQYYNNARLNAKTNEDEARFQDSVIKYKLLIYNIR